MAPNSGSGGQEQRRKRKHGTPGNTRHHDKCTATAEDTPPQTLTSKKTDGRSPGSQVMIICCRLPELLQWLKVFANNSLITVAGAALA
ncbi:hypothetical protein ASG44_10560 [Methylophilus sp. Leaf459]|nr:hypothetical protein ASG34_09030 [Methylophilus sp. Leaf416]KQT55874.1 hypothetical protein ASG44_10560 [Methylophilus sp. Leaf459]